MNAITNSERLKKVMRIALVGIRPADQVMLKGYLRILLRLEADLEWVSANHEAVDLFMINSEFSSSESVQRLLSTKNTAGVLYISRNETGDGHLVGNLLTLPLKELEELKQWLAENIGNIPTNSSAPSLPSQKTTQQSTSQQSSDNVLTNSSNNAQNLSNSQSIMATQSQPVVNTASNHLLSLIELLITVQRHEDRLMSLVDVNNSVLAHIHPKQQRIWLVTNDISLNQTLRLIPQSTFTSDPTKSQDLVQWLWQQGLAQASQLTGVLRPQLTYHITSWVKPSDGKMRHEQLKIQGVLESQEATLAQLAQLSQCDHNTIKRTVIGLVVAGVMSESVYQTLQQLLETAQTTAISSAESATHSISQPIQETSNLATSTPSPSHTKVSQDIQQTTGDKGMKGFLSSLRRKLGL